MIGRTSRTEIATIRKMCKIPEQKALMAGDYLKHRHQDHERQLAQSARPHDVATKEDENSSLTVMPR